MSSQSTVEAIEDYISEEMMLLPSFRKAGLHPSELGETPFCIRKGVFKHLDKKYSLNARKISNTGWRIFGIGHALHDYYRDIYLGPARKLYGNWRCSRCHGIKEGFMPKTACDCAVNVLYNKVIPPYRVVKNDSCMAVCGSKAFPEKVDERGGCNHCGRWGKWEYQEYAIGIKDFIPGYHVVGHIDGVILKDGKKCVLDIKTINTEAFNRLSGPKKNNTYQLQLYLESMGLKYGVLLYVCKNTGSMKEYDIEHDPDMILELKERAKLLTEAVAAYEAGDKVLPPIHPKCTKSSWICKYCPFGGEDSENGCHYMSTTAEFIQFNKNRETHEINDRIEDQRNKRLNRKPRKQKERRTGFNLR